MDRAQTESRIIEELEKQGALPVVVAKEDSENVVIDEAYLLRAESPQTSVVTTIPGLPSSSTSWWLRFVDSVSSWTHTSRCRRLET